MKPINVISVIQAKESLDGQLFKSYLNNSGIAIDIGEIDDIESLVDNLKSCNLSVNSLSGFFVGYKIPQIGKEFDLLKFDSDRILNIEVKREGHKKKMEKQLRRNYYYLSFVKKSIHCFSYSASDQALFCLNNNGVFEEVDHEILADVMKKMDSRSFEPINEIFDPTKYLISPFNSTKSFLKSNYFLTHQQENISATIKAEINSKTGPIFFSISGGPGTGKTLLIYDLAKSATHDGRSVLIIHCGNLNSGHEELNRNGFKIIRIKDRGNHDIGAFDVIIVDEAQRILPKQLDEIINAVKSNARMCLFSHDSRQTLSEHEAKNAISNRILQISGIKNFKLSEKIRTNAEISGFIKMLFNNKKSIDMLNKNNIELNYFANIQTASSYLDSIKEAGWELLRLTPSMYQNEFHEKYYDSRGFTSHEIIGQEYDNVAVVIDKYYSYDKDGDLFYFNRTYYDAVKMLFQNITRARKKLNIVIIENEKILERCINILT